MVVMHSSRVCVCVCVCLSDKVADGEEITLISVIQNIETWELKVYMAKIRAIENTTNMN